jgi:predicted MPP superfamily phosphohydrolase
MKSFPKLLVFTVLAAGMTAVLGMASSNAGDVPLKTFEAAIEAAKWNPMGSGSFYFVQATDLHLNDIGPLKIDRKMERKYEGRNFADDINRLEPKPKFLVVTGDTVSDTTRDPSSWVKPERGF